MMVGDVLTLGRRSDLCSQALLLIAAALGCALAAAQTIYKYQGDDGEWIFSDRPPDSDLETETRWFEAAVSPGELVVTHEFTGDSIEVTVRNSMYAVDVSMPVGTDVVASRGGIVFDVASENFKGMQNADQYADLSNLVRILHDDGTFAVYAHLNWNTIRVRPGDRVETGQYIADSGNTGFSSGPHLHFAVQRNMGRRVDSLPVAFRGQDDSAVRPSTGSMLSAYP